MNFSVVTTARKLNRFFALLQGWKEHFDSDDLLQAVETFYATDFTTFEYDMVSGLCAPQFASSQCSTRFVCPQLVISQQSFSLCQVSKGGRLAATKAAVIVKLADFAVQLAKMGDDVAALRSEVNRTGIELPVDGTAAAVAGPSVGTAMGKVALVAVEKGRRQILNFLLDSCHTNVNTTKVRPNHKS